MRLAVCRRAGAGRVGGRAAGDPARRRTSRAAGLSGLLPRPADPHRRQGRRRQGPAAPLRRQRVDPPALQRDRAGRPRRSPRRVLGPRPDEGRRHPRSAPTICGRRSRSIPTRRGRGPARSRRSSRRRSRRRALPRAAVDSRHRAEPVALPRSEGDDHRPVLAAAICSANCRTRPARAATTSCCARPTRPSGSRTCGRG